jgi:predicted amidohydrolase
MSEGRPGPRPAVLATCTFSPYPLRDLDDGDALLREGLAMIDEMAREADRQGESLDLVVWPEKVAQDPRIPVPEKAEPIDGRIITTVAERTRKLGTNAAVSLALEEDGLYSNALVFLDRQGQPVGVYRKINPVPGANGVCEGGLAPGLGVPVFDLDIGRVGAQICFDGYFEDAWRTLGREGAELVVFSSAMQAVMGLKAHAYTNQYYVLAATWNVPTVIVDPCGRELARTDGPKQVRVVKVDLDYRVYSDWRVQFVHELLEKYDGRIRMDWHPEELMWIVTSTDPALPVAEFMKAEKLATTTEYLAEAGAQLAKIRGEHGLPHTLPTCG